MNTNAKIRISHICKNILPISPSCRSSNHSCNFHVRVCVDIWAEIVPNQESRRETFQSTQNGHSYDQDID